MKRVSNELMRKELRKINNKLIVSIMVLVLASILIGIGFYLSRETTKNKTYFNDIITNDEIDKDNLDSYLKITMTPVRFAKLNGRSDKGLYITMDNKYYYIVALTNNDFNKIKNQDLDKKPLTLYGKTVKITSDEQSLAISYYNSVVSDEAKITDDKFFSTFGDLYLDTTKENITSTILFVVGGLSFIVGMILLIYYGNIKLKTNNKLKKIDDKELKKIENEINEKDALHYEKTHLVLTANYIISFLNGLTILKYEDIIWIYEHSIKQNDMITHKSIMIMNKEKKVKKILISDALTEKSQIDINEIITTITAKNKNTLVGYTKENKQKIKEYRKSHA